MEERVLFRGKEMDVQNVFLTFLQFMPLLYSSAVLVIPGDPGRERIELSLLLPFLRRTFLNREEKAHGRRRRRAVGEDISRQERGRRRKRSSHWEIRV